MFDSCHSFFPRQESSPPLPQIHLRIQLFHSTFSCKLKVRDLSLLCLLAAIWGGSFLLMRIASPEFGPFALVFLRLAIGALLLLPFAAASLPLLPSYSRSLFFVGCLNSAVPFSLLAYATLHLTSGVTAVLNATTPVLAAFIGALFLHQKLKVAQAGGLTLSLAGVALLYSNKLALQGPHAATAIAAALLAALCYAVAAHYSKSRFAALPPIASAFGTLAAATLITFPFAFFTWPPKPLPTTAWLAVLLLGLLCTGLAYFIYFRLIPLIGATRTSAVTLLVPLFAVIWGALILKERLTPLVALATFIILSGSYLALFARPRPSS